MHLALPSTPAEARKTKLDVAKEVMKGMLDRLAPDDQGGCSFHRAFHHCIERIEEMGGAACAEGETPAC